jgi:hypothetical protein
VIIFWTNITAPQCHGQGGIPVSGTPPEPSVTQAVIKSMAPSADILYYEIRMRTNLSGTSAYTLTSKILV